MPTRGAKPGSMTPIPDRTRPLMGQETASSTKRSTLIGKSSAQSESTRCAPSFAMRTKQNKKPKVKKLCLSVLKTYFHLKVEVEPIAKKYIYIFALSRTPRWKPGNNLWVGEVLHAKYEAKKSSLSGYTKTHTVFNASLLASLSETLAWLSKIRSMCSKLQSKLCYQESYSITLSMTKMPRNCSLRFLHYIVNLNRMHHVQSIKDGRGIDNEKKIFVVLLSIARLPHYRYSEKASCFMVLKPLGGQLLEKQVRI